MTDGSNEGPARAANAPEATSVSAVQNSFAFLFNVGDIEVPAQVIAGYQVRRATSDEIKLIKQLLSRLSLPPAKSGPISAYENRWSYDSDEKGVIDVRRTPLAEVDWRYYVVGYDGPNIHIDRLQSAFCLIDPEPEMLFSLLHVNDVGPGILLNPIRASHFLQSAVGDRHLQRITRTDLDDVRVLAEQIEKHDHTVVDLKRAFADFAYLSGTDPQGRLKLIGHFALIESLLSHAPKPSDPYDSITRQIRGKMTLIGNRSARINYSTYFGAAKIDKVWATLYGYRSAIAHGSAADFGGEFQLLRSADNVLAFIRHATRQLLRFALSEPVLLRDLKWA
jgi:hypothetical protein